MSPVIDDRTTEPSSASPCAEVRELLSSVVDGRATSAQELFVRTHLDKCPGCASELTFLRAMKAAWSKTPVAVPPASMSARIAAATYRKPTFSERFTAFFAFLQPAPMRVAVGVAAVAGIAYLTLPRVSVQTPVVVHPAITKPSEPVVAQNHEVEPAPVKIAPRITKPAPVVVKDTTPKPVVKKTSVVKSPAPVKKDEVLVAQVSKAHPVEAPVVKPVVPKATAPVKKTTQVAMIIPKHTHATPTEPKQSDTTGQGPKISNNATATEVATINPVTPVEKPQTKEPPAVKSAPAVAIVAGEDNPGFANGSGKLNLPHAGKVSQGATSGTAQLVLNSIATTGIVQAPIH